MYGRGKGLGTDFLRQLKRPRLLLYLINAPLDGPVEAQYRVLRRELEAHAAGLLDREAMIVLTKMDAWDGVPDTAALERAGHQLASISAVRRDGWRATLTSALAARSSSTVFPSPFDDAAHI